MAMGGRESGSPQTAEGRISLRKVRLDRGGYDSRGSYWGTGAPLYHAEDEYGGYSAYVRAQSRAEAAEKLGISSDTVKASKKRLRREEHLAVAGALVSQRRHALSYRLRNYIQRAEGYTTRGSDDLRRMSLAQLRAKAREVKNTRPGRRR